MINLNYILQSALQFPQSIASLSSFVENTCCLSCPAIYALAFTLLICLVSSVGISATSVQMQSTEIGVYDGTEMERVNGCFV
jgi:hypothetical protein